jgi:UDP-2,3-diacylglucosamine hydrolase
VSFSLFISDLHLSPDRPAATVALMRFLRDAAPASEALYVLGDLFEYWIGDDGLDQPFNREVVAAFHALAGRGVRLSFMHGNRDFDCSRFARKAATVIRPIWSTHGPSPC